MAGDCNRAGIVLVFNKILTNIPDRCYRLIFIICAVYSMLAALIPFARLVPSPPVQLAAIPLLLFGYSARGIPDRISRWFYYLMLTGSYQALRFVVNTHHRCFHGSDVIAVEKAIFGTLPTVWLQGTLHGTASFQWFDYVFALLHASLFAFPILLPAVLLWRRGAASMKRGTVAVCLITFAGYLTYILYPLTPPWMAWIEGDIPRVQRVVFDALGRFTSSWLQTAFQPSPRGAMPSLHAGVPVLTLLIGIHEFRRRAWWVALPVAGICFEVIYGAEHYVLDVLAGIVYAVITYLIVYKWLLPGGKVEGGCGDACRTGEARHGSPAG